MNKHLIILALSFLFTSSAFSQTKGYEVEKNLPVFYDKAVGNLTFPLAWRNWRVANPDCDFAQWREIARAKVFECMLTPPPYKAPDMRVLAQEKRDGYTAYKIEINLSEYSRVSSYLLVPDKKGKLPAIIMLHDHGAKFDIGKEKMVRPILTDKRSLAISESATAWVNKNYDSTFVGDFFAHNGYVVFATDALLWGERGIKGASKDEVYQTQQALAANMEQLGMCWSAFITYDDIASAEFVASLPYVDTTRISALGFSMGGYRAWMLSALSDHITSAAAVCWMNTTESMMSPENNQAKGHSSFSMTIPNIRNYLDFSDVASIACPKKLLIYNGVSDKLFPHEDVAKAYAIMHSVWDSQLVPDNLLTKTWNSGHFFSHSMQQGILEFLHTSLTD